MRRLFSTFAGGAPGAGLLILRFTAGIAAILQGLADLSVSSMAVSLLPELFVIAAGTVLLAGLGTPISAFLVAAVEIWRIASQHTGDPWTNILLASIGVALMLLGPGAWSLDARLFGWKRIDIRNRMS